MSSSTLFATTNFISTDSIQLFMHERIGYDYFLLNCSEALDSYFTTTAFAKCILADFHGPGHMKANAAVVSKNKLGPLLSDCIWKHLAYQNAHTGARVYGLVTKPRHNLKPIKLNYDAALEDLSEDIKKRRFPSLIFFAMSCVRGEAPIEPLIDK